MEEETEINYLSTPISEQKHIWAHIKHMRYVEYYGFMKKKNKIYRIQYKVKVTGTLIHV